LTGSSYQETNKRLVETINHDERPDMRTTTAASEGRSRISERPIVSSEQWVPLRQELLRKEKELTRHRDELNAERRELPWVQVEEIYVFDAPGGKVSLADLFAGRSQPVIYHFMFGPDWQEAARVARSCPTISTAPLRT
jgi:predicted dithiol-disulfide oxidoreductase (DUF899 family)